MKYAAPLCVLLSLHFCGIAPVSLAQTNKEIRIGLMSTLTGSFAISGEHCRQGYEVARVAFVKDGKIGTYKLKFIYSDTRGDAKTSVSEFRKLVHVDKVQAVVSTRSQLTMPLSSLAIQHKVPVVGIVGHTEFLKANSFGFRAWPTTSVGP